jgi:hypothetical protein
VLDTSALLSYIAADMRSVAVGELLASVEENGDTCGIPALCLLAASKRVKPEQLERLFEATENDGPAVVLPVLATDLRAIAQLRSLLSDDVAQAVVETQKHEAMLGTHDRKTYEGVLDEDDILDL